MTLDDKRPFLDRRYIETWLREHHMYKYELAWQAGITGGTLSKLIAGHVKPRRSTVDWLAEAMGVDPKEILIYPDEVPPEVNREYKQRKAKTRKQWRKRKRSEYVGKIY